MPLICFASQKGSPGTSAAALAVAAAFRPGEGRRKLLLEADLAGGALAIRYRLPTEPGLVTLAAAARAGLTEDELWRHTCELPGGLPAIVCPDGPEQVHSALAAAGALLGRHLAERRDLDVIADLGRLQPGSPAVELAAEATAVLMVARPVAEQLQPAAQRMLALRPRIKNLGWLLVGEKPHGPAEVESTFGFPVVGVLADDRRSVEAIEGGEVTRRVRRHPFVRSAATVAGTLGTWLSPLATAPAPSETTAEATDESDAGPAPEEATQSVPEPGMVTSDPAAPTEPVISPGSDAVAQPQVAPDPRPTPQDDGVGPEPASIASSPAPTEADQPITAPAADERAEPVEPADPIDQPGLPMPSPSVRIASDGRAGRPGPQALGPEPPPLESAPLAQSNGYHRPASAQAPSPGPEPVPPVTAGPAAPAVPDTVGSRGAAPSPVEPDPADPAAAEPGAANPRPAEPTRAEIDPPALPAPPLPPPRAEDRVPAEPDPFVHGDDDVEWTGT